MRRSLLVLTAAGVLILSANAAQASGILYVATDAEDFAGTFPDHLAKITTSGATVVSQTTIDTDYHVNGLADGGSFMYAGDALSSTLRKIDFDGNVLSSVAAGFASGCCNEDMAYDPAANVLYHPHWNVNIQALDPNSGAVLNTYAQDNVVGMAHVGSTIWITKWSLGEVGTWDPTTNTFTPVFNVGNAVAGMLAYDPLDAIMWVGVNDQMRPYSLAGNILGPDYDPFPSLDDTLDGGVFKGEAAIPEPTSLFLLGSGLVGLATKARRKIRG